MAISKVKETASAILAVAGVVSVMLATGGFFVTQYTRWGDVPERLESLSNSVDALARSVGKIDPQVVEFRGNGVLSGDRTVQAGKSIRISYVLRRNIACDTEILVRFYDHSNGTINNSFSYLIPAVKTAVSPEFFPFGVSVSIPADLPAGDYSYLPEIIPIDCGVYTPVIPPMSERFSVVGNGSEG